MSYKKDIIKKDQSKRILDYANLVLYLQEGDDGGGGINFCAPKFKQISHFFGNGKRLLFLGCANGCEVQEAKELGYDAYGVTLGIDNIIYAAKEYGIELFREDMHSTSFPAGSFDGVISFQTFEHSYSPLFFLLECNRLLKDGGKVFIEAPNINSGTIMDTNIHHVFCCNNKQLESLLMQSNFDKIMVGNEVLGNSIIKNKDGSGVVALASKKNIENSREHLRSLLYE